jgi:kumamolisin
VADRALDRVPLAGSDRVALAGSTRIGPADPDQQGTVTVLVRRRPDAPAFNSHELGSRSLAEREQLPRARFAEALGAHEADLAHVEAFARSHGLTVLESSPERRSVLVQGRVGELSACFAVELSEYENPSGRFRGRTGSIMLPVELEPIVEGVFGLDDRPQARAQYRIADPAAVIGAFTPVEVAHLYDFPSGLGGAGECVGIIELGGGYQQADLEVFFAASGRNVPTVVAVGVDGGSNEPSGDPGSADGEVLLDIEVVGAIAPDARIAVYFAPNTDQGFIDAVTTAVHDAENAPSVISISWGGPESSWTAQAQQALDQAFADAAVLGVTVCVASGDNGAGDGVGDGKAHVDFPASSPHALGCGGTRLQADGTTIAAESVWNSGGQGGASGGGISDTFAPPTWQLSAGLPPSVNGGGRVGRGVPDVAGDADPATGYRIEVDGRQLTIGGTSAVAPLWAGLIALLNEGLGKPIGFLNPLLYGLGSDTTALRDITTGSNTVAGSPGYDAGPGWDACTGLGSPDGTRLLTALTDT